MPTIKFLSNPSNNVKADERAIVPVSYQLEVTDLEKQLFCYVGTDIYVHGYIDGHPRDYPENAVVYDHDLRPGATCVVVADSQWFFGGDFDHVDEALIKHNARRLRAMLEEMRATAHKRMPYAISKDYNGGTYPASTESAAQWIEHHNKYENYEPLMPWDQLESYIPPPTYSEVHEKEQKELHELWAKQNGCPICANREYLEKLGKLELEITSNHDVNCHLATNVGCYHGEADWAINWLILHNKFEVEHSPRCTAKLGDGTICDKPILTSVYFGIDSWVSRVKRGLCDEHDPQMIRIRQEIQMQSIKKTVLPDWM